MFLQYSVFSHAEQIILLIWVLVPEMWCDISLRRENCKVQLLGLTALQHSWSQSVHVYVSVSVCVGGVNVGVCG